MDKINEPEAKFSCLPGQNLYTFQICVVFLVLDLYWTTPRFNHANGVSHLSLSS